jgi:hypothetical protein
MKILKCSFRSSPNETLQIYLYNILGWSSFPSICLIIRPSKFLIPEEEDDGTGGGRRLMTVAAVYPHVHVMFVLALQNCFCVVCRNLAKRGRAQALLKLQNSIVSGNCPFCPIYSTIGIHPIMKGYWPIIKISGRH